MHVRDRNLLFWTNKSQAKWNEVKTMELMDVWPLGRSNWCTITMRNVVATIVDGTCDHLICEKWTANAKHRVKPHIYDDDAGDEGEEGEGKNIQRKTSLNFIYVFHSLFGCYSSGISFNRSFFWLWSYLFHGHFDRRPKKMWRRRRLVFNFTLQQEAFPCVNFFFIWFSPPEFSAAR